MKISEDDIKARFQAKNGRTYIFLNNGQVLEEGADGELTQIDISNKGEKKRIRDIIGEGYTDVER